MERLFSLDVGIPTIDTSHRDEHTGALSELTRNV